MVRKEHPHMDHVVKTVSEHPDRHKILHKLGHTLHFDLRIKDILQIIIGATILAIPVGFTQEVWDIGKVLPWVNTIGIMALSIIFISLFVYYMYYKGSMGAQWDEFLKRIIATYLVSFGIVALLLTMIQVIDWAFYYTAIKTIILVTLPASMSAAIADILK